MITRIFKIVYACIYMYICINTIIHHIHKHRYIYDHMSTCTCMCLNRSGVDDSLCVSQRGSNGVLSYHRLPSGRVCRHQDGLAVLYTTQGLTLERIQDKRVLLREKKNVEYSKTLFTAT